LMAQIAQTKTRQTSTKAPPNTQVQIEV